MIYECTDCTNCASFDFGYRIVCLSKALPADAVYNYEPLGEGNADNCPSFDEGEPQHFSMKELDLAEGYWHELPYDITWEVGIRQWCEKQKATPAPGADSN